MIQRLAARANPAAPPAVPPEPLEAEACYRYCEALASARHHNFPVASLFVPTRLRRHLMAVYAFARTADDFADEPAFEGRRAAELDRWEERLHRCYFGEPPDHPVFVALADTVQRFALPITEFTALLRGCRTDLDIRRYPTFADLRNYTALAVEPIGHLALYLAGYRDPHLHRFADDLSTALALAKFGQDLFADLDRGRVYLPVEDLRHFGVAEADLAARRPSPALAALLRYQVARSRALFERARPLVDAVGDDLAIETALIWLGGMRILDKIAAAGADVVAHRPHLTALDKAAVVTRALAWRGRALRGRGASLRQWVGR
jgi:squalene synthase HpnC